MQKVRVDMHCDALTSGGFANHIKPEDMRGGVLQCFAAFTEDDDAAVYAAAVNLFKTTFGGTGVRIVSTRAQAENALSHGRPCCALTCENIGFTGGNYGNVLSLKRDGVIMASLVWNRENALAYPNVRADGKRETRGLKRAGEAAVRALDGLKIIVDISHLSDGGAAQILKGRKIPVVASHSDCDGVCKNARNLTDGQIRSIADCGGVIGVNFYNRFLGGDGGFCAVAAHLKHLINTGGENVPAFGSDWDGVPEGGLSIYPRNMPQLFEFLRRSGIPLRVLDKIFYKNFLRVFGEVCG